MLKAARVARWCSIALLTLLCGCALNGRALPPKYVALLAPFEGRGREIGYQAFYALRLALAEASPAQPLALLAVDDGGSPQAAHLRAQAITQNQDVLAVIVLGLPATDPGVLATLHAGGLAVIVAGSWGVDGRSQQIITFASAETERLLADMPRRSITEWTRAPAPLLGGEMLALPQFAQLRSDLSGVALVSSAGLPDRDFSTRYRAVDPFAPQPGLIAVAAYEAARPLLEISTRLPSATRAQLRAALLAAAVEARNTAPTTFYGYTADRYLIPIDGLVEQRER